MAKPTLPQNLQGWIEARKRHHLSHAHVQTRSRVRDLVAREGPGEFVSQILGRELGL